MIDALVSLAMGLAVGLVYGLVHVRSPAPPLIALVGLLGMVLGQQMVVAMRPNKEPPRSRNILQESAIAETPGEPAENRK